MEKTSSKLKYAVYLSKVYFSNFESSLTPLGSVPLDPNAEHWSEEIVDKHFEEDTGRKLRAVYVVQPGLSSRGGYFDVMAAVSFLNTTLRRNDICRVVPNNLQFF